MNRRENEASGALEGYSAFFTFETRYHDHSAGGDLHSARFSSPLEMERSLRMREERQGRSLPKRTTRPVVRTIPAALCRKKKPLKLEIVFCVG
jgi:hypothetical protein